jgi:4'-phosphopantetheinyl transferase
MESETLLAHEVHVWCAAPQELSGSEPNAAARALLAPHEAARLQRMRFAEDGLLYLATRVLVRTMLSRYAPVPPTAWRFTAGAHGRPELASGETVLRFNLSNAPGLVACAVTRDADIGIDVERIGSECHLEVGDRFFSGREMAALRRLPPDEQRLRFYEYWTLKESYGKARGLGLKLPLDRAVFTIEPGRQPRAELDLSLEDDAGSWQFAQQRPTHEHVLAVCWRRQAAVEAELTSRWHPLALTDRDNARALRRDPSAKAG